MANGSSSRIIFDSLGPTLFANTTNVADKVITTLEGLAQEIQGAAQNNAPWTDRTGEARAGLTAEVSKDGNDVVLELFHTVDYGQWLEIIQSGRFAVIMPTLEQYSDRVFAAVSAQKGL